MRYDKFFINLKPMGAVRMTNASKWVNPNAKKYLSYKAELSKQLAEQFKGETWNKATRIEAIFHFLPAKSNKEAKPGKPVTKKPDFDNLAKGLCDAANKVIWTDDAIVTTALIKKRYSHTDYAYITLTVYADEDEWEYMV